MKILVIDLQGVDLNEILAGESRSTIRQLIDMGGFGTLADGSFDQGLRVVELQDGSTTDIDQYLSENGKKTILSESRETAQEDIEQRIAGCRQLFADSRAQLDSTGWDYVRIRDCGAWRIQEAGISTNADRNRYLDCLDQEIVSLLELLTDDVILVVLFQAGDWQTPGDLLVPGPEAESRFILASANNPLVGDLGVVSWEELPPTLFELAGYAFEAQISGQSMIATRAAELLARADLAPDEAQIIRERLSGLGYIG
jgi:hypothetical protein